MATDELERDFDRAMRSIYDEAVPLGYRPTYFLRMLQQRGGVQTARDLLAVPGVSDGFTKLFELGRLDLSVEALVLKPRFGELFTDQELGVARKRLSDLRFEIPHE